MTNLTSDNCQIFDTHRPSGLADDINAAVSIRGGGREGGRAATPNRANNDGKGREDFPHEFILLHCEKKEQRSERGWDMILEVERVPGERGH